MPGPNRSPNWVVPTRPVGTSDNSAASTAFVAGAINTLPAYSTGIWTPTLTFATPGDLVVVYSLRTGTYTKIGGLVYLKMILATSTFTHTTASGLLNITGLPFAAAAGGIGQMEFQGITKAGYTQFVFAVNGSELNIGASGSGVALDNVTAANMPTGGTVILGGSIQYET